MIDYSIDEIKKGGNVTKCGSNMHNSKIYFLISNGEVVYVGKSISLDSRMQSHNSSGKVFDDFSFIQVPDSLVSDYEAYYIVKFNPKYNKTMPANNLYKSDKQAIELINYAVKKGLENISPLSTMSVKSNKRKDTIRRFYSNEMIDSILNKITKVFEG